MSEKEHLCTLADDVREMKSQIGEIHCLVVGNGKEPGLAEQTRSNDYRLNQHLRGHNWVLVTIFAPLLVGLIIMGIAALVQAI